MNGRIEREINLNVPFQRLHCPSLPSKRLIKNPG